MKVDLNLGISKRKTLNLGWGAANLTIGLFSHFHSHWVKSVPLQKVFPTSFEIWAPTYRICELMITEKPCPNIALEQFYVAVTILCFILSLVNFLIGIGIDLETSPYKFIDRLYHIISAVLLLVAGSLYIISSVQIYRLLNLKSGEVREDIPFKFRTYEKWIAGGLTILQAILYAMTPTVRRSKPSLESEDYIM